jgi:hypothetical protein
MFAMKFFASLVFALVAGTAVAFAVNHQVFGYRDASFGPMTLDGKVNATNAVATLDLKVPKGKARAEVPGGMKHNFGLMSPDEDGEHTFVIKNVGEEPLTLELGATTCKCTLGELDKSTLKPGEQTEIKLSWHVQTNANEFGQSAEVRTNDPTQPALRFEIEGNVVREMEMLPSSFAFGEVAAGESVVLESKIFNFMKYDIQPAQSKFTDDQLNALATIEVEPYQPTEEDDGPRSTARQAFNVKVTIAPGMKQGPVSQNFNFGFERVDESGIVVKPEGDKSSVAYFSAEITGRFVGALSMIPGAKLSGIPGGGYAYEFGRITEGSSLKAKTLVVLKGSERDHTTLRIGKITPEGAIKAKLEKSADRGSTVLYTLELELVPGDKPIELMGLSGDDYGKVWIESDNPKVAPLQLMVKFALPGKI